MTLSRRDLFALSLGLPALAAAGARAAGPAVALAADPKVTALGGAPGDAGSFTQGAYEQAIREGADILAAPLVPTRDGWLAVRADPELSGLTDVAERPEFAGRRRRGAGPAGETDGWFAEDFTLAELKALALGPPGARRRGPPAPGKGILSFDDVIAIARAGSVRTARVIGVQAVVFGPERWAGLDPAPEARVADAIRTGGYDSPAAAMTVVSDSLDWLKALGALTRARRLLRIVQGRPAAELADEADGLVRIHAYAWGIAPDVRMVVDLASPKTLPPTGLAGAAHAAGLAVQAWIGEPPAPFRASDARRLAGAAFAAGCEMVAGYAAAPVARARDDLLPRDRD